MADPATLYNNNMTNLDNIYKKVKDKFDQYHKKTKSGRDLLITLTPRIYSTPSK